MKSSSLRKIILLYVLLMILGGVGYAKYDTYRLDGDAVSFMDIADAIRGHDFALVVNGYWNPAYAAALAIGQTISHPSRWNELQAYYWVNFWIYVGCIFACIYFVRSLALVRDHLATDERTPPAISSAALQLLALAFLFISFQRELSLGAVRSDSLLLFFFFLAAGFVLRIQSGGAFIYYPLLGAALGLAYLTKSFAFLPSGVLLAFIFFFGLTRKTPARTRIAAGAVVAGVVFAALSAPYIIGISKQRGRPTTGESARLNYAFFVDGLPRWHEAHTGDLGHATADFKHPEEVLLNSPPVYSYLRHPYGTYPLWFDPAYWTDTIKPKIYLKGQIQRIARNVVVFVRFMVGHLEPFVVLAVLLLAGAFFPRDRRAFFVLLPAAAWGLLMFAIYFPVDLQDRYLSGAYLLIFIPLFAMLRRPAASCVGDVATGVALLMAFLAAADGARVLGELRRTESVTGYPRGAYSKQIYHAARGLNDLGIGPGQTVACFGDQACYVDPYWERLAGTPVRSEIEVPDGGEPALFWEAQPNKQQIVDALRSTNVSAVVAVFAPSAHIPEGWHQLGDSDFYAYLITPR